MGDKSKGDMLRMATGDVFGESCLEPTADNATRKANVVAVGPVKVLRLTAAKFKEHLGSLQDVVGYNFKRKVRLLWRMSSCRSRSPEASP